MKKHLLFLLGLCLPFAFVSCDDNDEDPLTSESNILISSRLPTPDGMSGTTFTQFIDCLNGKTYDNSNAYETSYAAPVVHIGDYLYDLPGYSNDKDEVRKYSYSNGELSLVASYTCPASSRTSCIVAQGNKGYLSMFGLGIVQVIDLSTMKYISSIDLTSYDASGDGNPDPGMMVLRDGLLYVALTQSTTTTLPPADRAKADVVIIDTQTDKVVKVITDERGFSCPGDCMQGNPYCLFVDEKNDIYINCVGGRGYMPTHKMGLLRIKSGETEFDQSYSLCVNDISFEGLNNPLDKLSDMLYTENGKYYATSYSSLDFSTPADYLADKVIMCLEIDIWNKTIKKLNFPMGNIFATCVGKYNDLIIFGLATKDGEGFYSYNPQTITCSDKPIVNTTGYPFAFQVIE